MDDLKWFYSAVLHYIDIVQGFDGLSIEPELGLRKGFNN
jgi:hypothetical protein